MRAHGGYSRRYTQKSFKIYARKEYGKKHIKNLFFADRATKKLKHLVLKPLSAGWTEAVIEDQVCQQMAKLMNLDRLSEYTAVMYLNGEYWGIYILQERIDEHYIEETYGVAKDSCIIMNNYNRDSKCGSPDTLVDMMDYVNSIDTDCYEYLRTRIDIENFTDYYLFEMFIANRDWPANNTKCWRPDNGRWRWIFFDGDAALKSLYWDYIANATDTSTIKQYPTNSRSTLLFRKLLENETYREYCAERVETICRTILTYDNTKKILDSIIEIHDNEIEKQASRFGDPKSYRSWCNYLKRMDKFLKKRPVFFEISMKSFLNTTNSVEKIDNIYKKFDTTTIRHKVIYIIANILLIITLINVRIELKKK